MLTTSLMGSPLGGCTYPYFCTNKHLYFWRMVSTMCLLLLLKSSSTYLRSLLELCRIRIASIGFRIHGLLMKIASSCNSWTGCWTRQEIPRVLHRCSAQGFQMIWKYWMMTYELGFSQRNTGVTSVIYVLWQTWACEIAIVQVKIMDQIIGLCQMYFILQFFFSVWFHTM